MRERVLLDRNGDFFRETRWGICMKLSRSLSLHMSIWKTSECIKPDRSEINDEWNGDEH